MYSSRTAVLVVASHSYWYGLISAAQYESLEARVRRWYAGMTALSVFSLGARGGRLFAMLFCLIAAAEMYQLMACVIVVDLCEVLSL